MAKLILGIAGEIGSGKGSIAEYVGKEYKGATYRFSTILRDVLDRLCLKQSRENIQTLSTMLRKNFGEDLFAKVIYNDTKNDSHEIIIIDGVRRMEDIIYLKELPHFKFIYVDVDLEIRYKRVIERNENSGDSEKNIDEFKKEEKGEPETQIRDLKNYADYVINNNGAYENLCKQVDDIVKQYIS